MSVKWHWFKLTTTPHTNHYNTEIWWSQKISSSLRQDDKLITTKGTKMSWYVSSKTTVIPKIAHLMKRKERECKFEGREGILIHFWKLTWQTWSQFGESSPPSVTSYTCQNTFNAVNIWWRHQVGFSGHRGKNEYLKPQDTEKQRRGTQDTDHRRSPTTWRSYLWIITSGRTIGLKIKSAGRYSPKLFFDRFSRT